MNLDDLTIGQAKQLTEMFAERISGNTKNNIENNKLDGLHVGKHVIVRTYSAGVHCGVLVEKCGMEVLLDHSRRFWNWEGAFTLNEVANAGISAGKISEKTNGVLLTQSIEIIPLTTKAKEVINDIKDHNP